MANQPNYENTDMSVKLISFIALTMIILAVLMHLGIDAGFLYLRHRMTENEPQTIENSLVSQRKPPASPRLQQNPVGDYKAYQASQQDTLNSYRWVDRKKGIVHVPIDRAIDLLIQRELKKGP